MRTEMAEKSSLEFDLQLFNDDVAPVDNTPANDSTVESTPADTGKPDYSTMSKGDVSAMLDNYHNPKSVEQADTDKTDPTGDKPPANDPGEKPDATPEPSKKFKVKVAGQERELSLEQLVEMAQKGDNYERKVQETAMQRKSYEEAMKQQQEQWNQPPQSKPEDKLQTLQQQIDSFASVFKDEYGVEFNPYDTTHQVAFYQHQAAKQAQEQTEKQTQEAQSKEYNEAETHYQETFKTLATDKEFLKVNQFAEQAFLQLPSKGAEGLAKFKELYDTYQKIKDRDQHFLEIQQTGRSNIQVKPFTKKEVNNLKEFYDQAKKDYYAKQFAPKNADTSKKPVSTEKVTPGEKREAPKPTKADYANMSKSEVSAMLNGYLVNKIKK